MSAQTEWYNVATDDVAKLRPRSPLLYFLVFVSILFIGILVFAFVVTKRSNPVYLDEHGKPVAAGSEHSHH